MQTKNSVSLIGRIGADPETKETKSNKILTTFSLATEETWKDGEEKKSVTEWHNIEMWGNKNLIKYLKKGGPIAVDGKLRTSSYAKTVGGEKVTMYRTSVVVETVYLLDSGKSDK